MASSVRPVRELKDFKKVYFKAFEEKTIAFKLTVQQLKFWNERLDFKVEQGEFKVFVGPNSREGSEAIFSYK